MVVSTNRWNGLKALILGLGVLATIGLTPTVSQAIPSAGKYDFTSGLTGYFISDGTQLTVYHIEALHTTWDSPPAAWETMLYNDSTQFAIITGENAPCLYCGLFLDWTTDHAWERIGGLDYRDLGQFTYTVPEPTSMSLIVLGLGLLALVGYRGRQRHQAGLQIG